MPEGDEKSVGGGGGGGTTSASVVGGNFQLTTVSGGGLVERGLPGADIEAGYKFDLPDNWDMWAYGGGFHFDANGYKNVSGPRGRLELAYNGLPYLGESSRFTVGFETQTDNVRGGQSWGIARLRIPLQNFSGKKSDMRPALSALDKRMTARVQRDIDIVSAKGSAGPVTTTSEAATVTINNRTYGSVTEVSAATADVPAAVTAAGVNSLVLFNGTGGTINTTDNINMLNGQTLIGGGSVLTATGGSGATAPLTMPGTRPTISSTDADAGAMAVRLTFNTAVIGIDITSPGVTAIGIGTTFASTNSLIEDVSVQGVGAGITISGSFGVRVRNARISNVTSGLNVVGNSGATVEDLTVNNATGTGVTLQNTSQLTLDNALITNVQNGIVAGVLGAKTLTMNNVEIGAASGNGVTLQNVTVSAGTGNRITGPIAGTVCVNNGGTTGSLAFDDIQGGGPGTCP